MDTSDKFWYTLGIMAAVLCFVILTCCYFFTARTVRYEMTGDQQNGVLGIQRIVDNGPDNSFALPRNMTPVEIAQLVDSLNASLKKYPYPKP